MKDDIDVVVAGGGPAGLLMASKLSLSQRVLLFDRNELGETSKFWLTTTRRLTLHALEKCILFSSRCATLGTYLGSYAEAVGDYAVVNEQALLKSLITRCEGTGVSLNSSEGLVAVTPTDDGVVVETDRRRVTARLLIDATGGMSSIAKTFRLHKIDGFFSVYGCHFDRVDLVSENIVGAAVIRLGFPPPIFELIPTGSDSAFCVIFLTSRSAKDPVLLKNVFDEHVKNNPYFRCTRHTRRSCEKMGLIPIGSHVRRRISGVIPFGEAALFQSPLLGTAFNDTLELCDGVARQVRRYLGEVVSPWANRRVWSSRWTKFANDLVQRLLVRRIIDGSVEDVDWLVRLIGSLGRDCAYRLCAGELTSADAMRCAAWSVSPRSNVGSRPATVRG